MKYFLYTKKCEFSSSERSKINGNSVTIGNCTVLVLESNCHFLLNEHRLFGAIGDSWNIQNEPATSCTKKKKQERFQTIAVVLRKKKKRVQEAINFDWLRIE